MTTDQDSLVARALARLRIPSPPPVPSVATPAVEPQPPPVAPEAPPSPPATAAELADFQARGVAVRFFSCVLGCPIWLVGDAEDRDRLRAEGITDPVYLAAEVPALRGLSPGDLRRVHEVRAVFGGTVAPPDGSSARPLPSLAPEAPRRCACGATTWWRSIHGAMVCSVCHPPADPSLIAETPCTP